ncbi:hypothetical protein [Flagellimonas meishanensis]|uniref:hypothetical protein n=1 Tax=Flagellimonas meishanensis TaxID=2873264 RepID=UPI001CA6B869|nr:hypothetical protein [[Muricauda] meishanensis]
MARVFGVLLFVTLMMFKVTALHVYSHQDDNGDTVENCQICHVLVENQTVEVPFVAMVTLPIVPITTVTVEVAQEQTVWESQQYGLSYISRPPPFSLV